MKIKLLYAVAAVMALAACADELDGVSQVRITPRIETRVTGLHFDAGDCIGLTITKNLQTYADNVPMTYDGAEFSGDVMWYNDLNEKSTLTAYYPYLSSGMPAEFSVAADQSQGCTPSDLLAAVKTDVTPVSSAVNMVFRHLLSQLTLLIDNTSGGNVSEVVVGGLIPVAEVDYAALRATVKSTAAAADIKTWPESAGVRHRVILVPQQADLTVIVRTDDGKSHEKTVASALLEGGRKYDLAVRVTDAEISLSLSGDIEDWEPGGSLGGDGDPGDGDELEYQGDKYRTATIGGRVWMAENMRYVPDASLLGNGIWYPCKEGAAGTDPTYVRQRGMLYSYTVAGAGVPLGAGNVQGICPSGWQIPSSAELTALAGVADFDFASFMAMAGAWNLATMPGRYISEAKGYLMSCDRGVIDELITTLNFTSGGAPTVGQLSAKNGLSLRCVKNQ